MIVNLQKNGEVFSFDVGENFLKSSEQITHWEADKNFENFRVRAGEQKIEGHAYYDERRHTLHLTIDGYYSQYKRVFPSEMAEATHAGTAVVSPLPGKIIKVLCEEGEHVKKDQPLIVMDAMKMEHTLAAPVEGMVSRLNAKEAEQVDAGAILIEVEPHE